MSSITKVLRLCQTPIPRLLFTLLIVLVNHYPSPHFKAPGQKKDYRRQPNIQAILAILRESIEMIEGTFAVNVHDSHLGLLRLCLRAIGCSFALPVALAVLCKKALFASLEMIFHVPIRLRCLFSARASQHLAIEIQKQAHQYASPNGSIDSLPSLISPGSSTYSSHIGDLDLDPDDDDDDDNELPSLPYIPPTPEGIKRWVELSAEARRRVADVQHDGLNWMSCSPPPSPRLPLRDLPKERLRRWWGEATEEDRARINRISTDGLNWRTWGPPPQPSCDGEPVVWSGIGPWVAGNGDDGLPYGTCATGSSEQTLHKPIVDWQSLAQRHPQNGLPSWEELPSSHEVLEYAVSDTVHANLLLVVALSSAAEQSRDDSETSFCQVSYK
ncbi:uncharacterized protein B0T23DRAFT_437137 [Neurospora hispaniola]|uniref:Uncharacterized protein n=1 Tax=Neurospora hispaniola TaxID=588809 RepID=A0AAJ0HXN1_9PEZI|nr:hypothetical protein B0T23DRAFT_437137 [Neurospora hispaniola]